MREVTNPFYRPKGSPSLSGGSSNLPGYKFGSIKPKQPEISSGSKIRAAIERARQARGKVTYA